jgi:hypothetical protein
MRTHRLLMSVLFAAAAFAGQSETGSERHFLYVAEPGIRNYVEYGGIGILVFDIITDTSS